MSRLIFKKVECPRGVLIEMNKPIENFTISSRSSADLSHIDMKYKLSKIGMTEGEGNLIIPEELIGQKIYIIRECKVMLDKDLADLFDVRLPDFESR